MVDINEIDRIIESIDDNDINMLLKTYNDINVITKELIEKCNILKDKIKIVLKERQWKSYKDDESNISVSLLSQERETINKNALKILLNDEQFNQILTKTSYEKMLIVTPKDRERLNKYVKNKR
jgi:uncharacterized SAM-dependent methyltransferase